MLGMPMTFNYQRYGRWNYFYKNVNTPDYIWYLKWHIVAEKKTDFYSPIKIKQIVVEAGKIRDDKCEYSLESIFIR